MHIEPVSASFRALVERCLAKNQFQNQPEAGSDFSHNLPFSQQRLYQDSGNATEIRTELNVRVIEDFLRP
ncbi:MAG: hypothetical protein EOM80_04200 [Erysipelotrichia bacterium]|nr:hypothetical protein [Erysipelotrichia bacterium]